MADGASTALAISDMINVRAFALDVECFCSLDSLPSLASQRPTSCPCCQQPAYPPGRRLGIYGHGTFKRQVRGIAPGQWLVIFVRRFRCTRCGVTISVLPDFLVARRYYLGATILRVLIEVLLKGTSVAQLRESVGPSERAPHWHAPGAWARDLGRGIWSGAVPGIAKATAPSPAERLQKLLGAAGLHKRSLDAEIKAAADKLSCANGSTPVPA